MEVHVISLRQSVLEVKGNCIAIISSKFARRGGGIHATTTLVQLWLCMVHLTNNCVLNPQITKNIAGSQPLG